jgi:hypothetical protein
MTVRFIDIGGNFDKHFLNFILFLEVSFVLAVETFCGSANLRFSERLIKR